MGAASLKLDYVHESVANVQTFLLHTKYLRKKCGEGCRWRGGKYRSSWSVRSDAQIGQNVHARSLSIGVSHTYDGGMSHTDGRGVSHTDFEAIEVGLFVRLGMKG